MAMALAVGALGAVPRAFAESSPDDNALATILFQQGRALMSEGRIPEACQKLEESQRLHAGGGTLLNLALCHEQEGRLARSWSEFKEALIVARRDGRPDREVEAANHVDALEPRLSRLTIVVPPETQVEGLVIARDGRELGRAAWATSIPIDGGKHVVRATAPGKEPFTATVDLATENDAQTVEIPVLATPVMVVTPPRIPAAAPPVSPSMTPARLRWGGVGAAAAGVVLLGTAGYALATALRAMDESNSQCWSDGCSPTGLRSRNDAVSRGNWATLLGVGGIVLVGGGATMFYLGRRSIQETRETRVAARVTLDVTKDGLVTGIGGSF